MLRVFLKPDIQLVKIDVYMLIIKMYEPLYWGLDEFVKNYRVGSGLHGLRHFVFQYIIEAETNYECCRQNQLLFVTCI